MLVIAHRLSTIRGANQIAVLHSGKLQEVCKNAPPPHNPSQLFMYVKVVMYLILY